MPVTIEELNLFVDERGIVFEPIIADYLPDQYLQSKKYITRAFVMPLLPVSRYLSLPFFLPINFLFFGWQISIIR